MLAMFVAVASSRNFWNVARVTLPRRLPSAFLRLSARTPLRTAELFAERIFAPFLFDQNPRVRPPPAPVHRLPNSTFPVSPSASEMFTGFGVVWTQLASTGVPSVTV